ncbi:MAG: stage IV sporulation protein A [Ruminococcaceae bacterium]|nr:stage IV sporulation protein A [Oscillospiraceae bacterium]
MAEHSIYRDIAERTGGDIYIGVVGPVRSGKSTFITRFMQELVLPNMEESAAKERARDEMPQSAAGKTVMTTEPKFVPDEGVSLTLEGGIAMRVKMIDCVGYMIPEAMGGEENGEVRLVHTPWSEEPMPFPQAAEYGTRKVIGEHATIGMLVTSDGTVGEIPRASYIEAEERIVSELSAMGKPFAVVLNSADPTKPEAVALAAELEEKYRVPVALVSCLSLGAEDIRGILAMILGEFPVTAVGLRMPAWSKALEEGHAVRRAITEDICRLAGQVDRMGSVGGIFEKLAENPYIEKVEIGEMDMGTGRVCLSLSLTPALYYDVLSELAGEEIREDETLFRLVREFAEIRRKYARVEEALESADEKGYGIVMPEVDDLRLEKPTIVKQSGGYGVRLSAAAQSLHMIRADIRTELNPIVGTEQQSEEFVRNILAEFESDPKKLWASNMFGKSLYEMVNEGLHQKLEHMPEDARKKMAETLERIINEGSNGLICILL